MNIDLLEVAMWLRGDKPRLYKLAIDKYNCKYGLHFDDPHKLEEFFILASQAINSTKELHYE